MLIAGSLSFLLRQLARRHETGEDFPGSFESSATVHGGVVVDEDEVAGLPIEVEGELVGKGAGGGDVGGVERGAVRIYRVPV